MLLDSPSDRDLFDVPLPDIQIPPGSVSVIATAYNEALRIEDFLRHHRAIGVETFFIIDNGSTDATPALLAGQPDVVTLRSSASYAEHRGDWWRIIGERYLRDRWVLTLDADELLVYPGWPARSIHDLAATLDRGGHQALFTSMVDMYAAEPMRDIAYRPGDSVIGHCAYFDSDGYRLVWHRKPREGFPCPPYDIFGGPRERIFLGQPHQIPGQAHQFFGQAHHGPITRLLHDWTLGLDRREPGGPLVRRVRKSLRRRLPSTPFMSKVPLVKWGPGRAYRRGPHCVNLPPSALSPEWGALLHFKYLQDFAQKTETAIARGQHWRAAEDYRTYQRQMARLIGEPLTYAGTRRFESDADLERAGLIRSAR